MSSRGRIRSLEKAGVEGVAAIDAEGRAMAEGMTRLRENIAVAYGGGPTGEPPMTPDEAREYRRTLRALVRDVYAGRQPRPDIGHEGVRALSPDH